MKYRVERLVCWAAVLPSVVGLLLVLSTTGRAGPIVEVRADTFFNPTGILASPGEMFQIQATGTVDISTLNGGYMTDPNGTITETPPPDSGSFMFFRDRALPIGVPPLAGTQKIFEPLAPFLPGHLPGAPYGALVAGFSTNPNPSSFSDFPSGFSLIGTSGIATTPSIGGFLFLGVNDFNNPGGDNAGSFTALVQIVPEPSTLTMGGTAALLGLGYAWRRRTRKAAD